MFRCRTSLYRQISAYAADDRRAAGADISPFTSTTEGIIIATGAVRRSVNIDTSIAPTEVGFTQDVPTTTGGRGIRFVSCDAGNV